MITTKTRSKNSSSHPVLRSTASSSSRRSAARAQTPWLSPVVLREFAVSHYSLTVRATIASELTGRPINLAMLDADEWITAQLAAGQPEGMARFTLGVFQAAQGGFFAGTDPLLGTLLGRAPRTVRDELTP